MSGSRKKFVLLPRRGLSAGSSLLSASTASFFHSLSAAALESAEAVAATDVAPRITVLDSIREDGAKLVEMSEADALDLHHFEPDVQAVPILYYRLARAARHTVRAAPSLVSIAAQPGTIRIIVTDVNSGKPVPGAQVAAFTDFENRFGAGGTSDAAGEVELAFGTSPVTIERLFVYPPLQGYWGAYREDFTISGTVEIAIEPVDPSYVDGLIHFHGVGSRERGEGVAVGVIDTGVGPHADLPNAQGDIDNGEGHGTHVAGIIGARGTAPDGRNGIAPGVTIRSYRVFGVPGGLSANYDIAKAIDRAVLDGCDLINLSLSIDPVADPSGTAFDPVVQYAMEDARQSGVLPIAAAGNDYRTPVNFPAKDSMAFAVSALGRLGTFPAESNEAGDVLAPFGEDENNFIAAFSNVGPEIDLTGPGVGIISTVPGGYGVMSGTSMACPAVVGMTARHLSQSSDIIQAERNAQRSAQIARLALRAASSLGFPPGLEGRGLVS
jgi:subtilisin